MRKLCDRSPPARAARLLAVVGCAVLMLAVASPAFGTTYTFSDPDDVPNDGYDIKSIELNDEISDANEYWSDIDSDADEYLQIKFTTYGDPLLPYDQSEQIFYMFVMDVHAFDQDTTKNPQAPAGMYWDFKIYWYGNQSNGDPVVDKIVLEGQDGFAMWTSATVNPGTVETDTLTLQIPWIELVDTSDNEAFPDESIYPPGISFWARMDSVGDDPDDRVPGGTGIIIIPEPLTMLGMFFGIAGISGYLRKRRRA